MRSLGRLSGLEFEAVIAEQIDESEALRNPPAVPCARNNNSSRARTASSGQFLCKNCARSVLSSISRRASKRSRTAFERTGVLSLGIAHLSLSIYANFSRKKGHCIFYCSRLLAPIFANLRIQPGAREGPVAFGGALRDPHDLASLLISHACKKAEVDQAGRIRVFAGEFLNRLIHED